MDLEGRTILAHKGFFDRAAEKIYQENSREACAAAAKKDHIGIIEVDVRKSKDGVLYCYHGNLFQYCVTLRFPRRFADLRAKYGVDALADILDVIPPAKAIFLDMKETDIAREDILRVFKGRSFKEVILGNRSPSFLARFHDMPPGFVKNMNGNIFCGFVDPVKLRAQNFKYFEVPFPFQIRKRLARRVRTAGLEFSFAAVSFLSASNYWKKVRAYDPAYVASDFI